MRKACKNEYYPWGKVPKAYAKLPLLSRHFFRGEYLIIYLSFISRFNSIGGVGCGEEPTPCARRAGRGRRKPRGGLRSYGAGARLRENSFSVQKNCVLNTEGLSPYRHQFILAGYARANKRNPHPPCRFSVFLHACSVPLRWGERAFFWSFPGRSPAARAVFRGKARRAPPRSRARAAAPAAFVARRSVSGADPRDRHEKKNGKNAALSLSIFSPVGRRRYWVKIFKKCLGKNWGKT